MNTDILKNPFPVRMNPFPNKLQLDNDKTSHHNFIEELDI